MDTKEFMIILPIKKKWFDMVRSGEKTEEYRELKPYYIVRFLKALGFPKTEQESVMELLQKMEAKKPLTILFRNGYSKTSPSFLAECYLSIGKGKEKWGAVLECEYFILRIARVY